jgi:hypothetical protein
LRAVHRGPRGRAGGAHHAVQPGACISRSAVARGRGSPASGGRSRGRQSPRAAGAAIRSIETAIAVIVWMHPGPDAPARCARLAPYARRDFARCLEVPHDIGPRRTRPPVSPVIPCRHG